MKNKIINLLWDDWLGVPSFFGAILAVVLILAALVIGVRQVDYHYTSTYCDDKLKQVQREGKFVEYNYWEYDCLVRAKDGTYIPLDNLYNNVQENNIKDTKEKE